MYTEKQIAAILESCFLLAGTPPDTATVKATLYAARFNATQIISELVSEYIVRSFPKGYEPDGFERWAEDPNSYRHNELFPEGQYVSGRKSAIVETIKRLERALRTPPPVEDDAPAPYTEDPLPRDEEPSTHKPEAGVKYDSNKPRPGLLPPNALLSVVDVLTFGANKYPSADNWKRVDNAPVRYLDAALRHIIAHMSGERTDQESNLPHLAHAVTCLLFILELNHDQD